MAAIDRDEIARLARLARLSLEPDEAERIARELTVVVGYVSQLGELDLEGVEPTAHGFIEQMSLREDVPAPSLSTEEALAEAPISDDHAFVVPAFVEGG